jgi:hypothetical protein
VLFLDRFTLYRIIQRELPPNAYPDGAPNAYYSTADSFATAQAIEDLYTAASGTYEEMFPATSTRRIDDWVKSVFGQLFDATVTTSEKQARVLAKMQKIGSLSNWAILTLALGYVPPGTYIQIYHPCGPMGDRNGWQLGVSTLGYNTYLAVKTPAQIGIPPSVINNFGANWCPFISNLHWRLGVDELGFDTFLSDINYVDIMSYQQDAYLYEVRIFNFGQPQLTPVQLSQLSNDLSANEPARSAHRIFQNLDINASGLDVIVPDINQASDIDCACVDSTSTTGYTGRTS